MNVNGTPKLQTTVKFQPNVPVEVALEYASGKPVESQFSGRDEVMFTLTNGQRMYLDPFVARKIEALGIGRGEAFTMCKTVKGAGKTRAIEWQVYRKEGARVTSDKTQGLGARDEETVDEAPPVEWEYGLAPARPCGAAPLGIVIEALRAALRVLEGGRS